MIRNRDTINKIHGMRWLEPAFAQLCFASMARLQAWKSRNPNPTKLFSVHIMSHRNQ
ncbi:hypothetical protein SLEP1_g49488 [Rubroshorea leprosula]|uniref:Uncharacterized protein n=1 Tax=Rubroshorea leprosula TaxID=152421 RepID=A0AAV5LXX6_9ROSI|nr:hypothetical protein SLEP1_g49488 [Rubroshorea leprosula]